MPLLDAKDPAGVHAAAGHVAAGELLAFPTETVYGLGARADDDAAVARIFEAKGRPAEHPLIVHAAGLVQARQFALQWPPLAQTLAQAFWPGPLTIIVERQPQMARAAAGGQASIGLRVPAHPLAQALLHEAHRLGVAGIAAPSANRFGGVSATTAAHVEQEFGPAMWVLDGGECPGGIESAIVDCTGPGAVLLRPGLLPRARIEAVLGTALGEPDDQSPRASGTLRAHYAPRAKVRLMPLHALREALALLVQHPSSLRLAVYSRSGVPSGRGIESRHMPDSAAEAAHELFAVLREFDAQGAQLIWIEQPPASADWEGVRDRLERAAAA
ncbi:MAG: L-threonylcarbamoyladenylate synthase [Rubrivivax sp.]